jgi:hypothetical protein
MAVLHKIVKLVKNGVLMIIHIYAKVSIMHIRKQMEQMRHDKIIGSSLDAEVDIYCDDNAYNLNFC